MRSADQRRADAAVQLALDALHGTGSGELPREHGMRPTVNVCIALSTLLGLDEQPGALAGSSPIPASVARRIAADQTGTWRRLVTDEMGRLLDYGRSTYRPPKDLTDHVIARRQHPMGITNGHRYVERPATYPIAIEPPTHPRTVQ